MQAHLILVLSHKVAHMKLSCGTLLVALLEDDLNESSKKVALELV